MQASSVICGLLGLILLAASSQAAPEQPDWACQRPVDKACGTQGCKLECAGISCSARNQRLQGEVIALSLPSYTYTGVPNPAVAAMTPARCCQACQDLDQCRGWLFCNNKAGCGSDCSTWSQRHSKEGQPSPLNSLPHLNLPRGQGCKGNAWPYGMCTLLAANSSRALAQLSANGTEQGWVSGVVPKGAPADSRCAPGTSAATCRTCVASADPSGCLKCAAGSKRLWAAAWCAAGANQSNIVVKAKALKCLAPSNASQSDSCLHCLALFQGNPQRGLDCLRCFAEPPKAGSGSTCDCFDPTLPTASQAACADCSMSYNATDGRRAGCLQCRSLYTEGDSSAEQLCYQVVKAASGDKARLVGQCKEIPGDTARTQLPVGCLTCIKQAVNLQVGALCPAPAAKTWNLGGGLAIHIAPDYTNGLNAWYACVSSSGNTAAAQQCIVTQQELAASSTDSLWELSKYRSTAEREAVGPCSRAYNSWFDNSVRTACVACWRRLGQKGFKDRRQHCTSSLVLDLLREGHRSPRAITREEIQASMLEYSNCLTAANTTLAADTCRACVDDLEVVMRSVEERRKCSKCMAEGGTITGCRARPWDARGDDGRMECEAKAKAANSNITVASCRWCWNTRRNRGREVDGSRCLECAAWPAGIPKPKEPVGLYADVMGINCIECASYSADVNTLCTRCVIDSLMVAYSAATRASSTTLGTKGVTAGAGSSRALLMSTAVGPAADASNPVPVVRAYDLNGRACSKFAYTAYDNTKWNLQLVEAAYACVKAAGLSSGVYEFAAGDACIGCALKEEGVARDKCVACVKAAADDTARTACTKA